MEYDIKDKLEWTVIFILEFGRKYGLTMKQALWTTLRSIVIVMEEHWYETLSWNKQRFR